MTQPTNTEIRIATYKNHRFRLLFLGKTKFGQKAHLAYLDGSKDFWVEADKVQVHEDSQTLAEVRKPATPVSGNMPKIPAGSQVTYKGYQYKLLWMGATKFGYRAHVSTLDGSKEFWVDANAVKAEGAPAPQAEEPRERPEKPAAAQAKHVHETLLCTMCQQAPAEVEHPEYAGAMICGKCFLTFDVPF